MTERTIASKLIRACLAKGHALSVYDGEEWTVRMPMQEIYAEVYRIHPATA